MSRVSLLEIALLAAMLSLTSSLQAQTTSNELRTWAMQAEARMPAPLLSRSELKSTGVQSVFATALAPDGSKAGYLIREGVTTKVMLRDLNSNQTTTLLSNDRLQKLEWTSDSRALLLTMKDYIALLPLDTANQPRYLYRLDSKRKQKLVGVVPGTATHQQVLIASTTNGISQLTLADGQSDERQLYEGDGTIKHAFSDTDARHLFLQVDTATDLRILAIETQGPRVLLQCKVYETCDLEAYDAVNGKLWIREHHDNDLLSLYSLDPVTSHAALEQQDPAHLSDMSQVCYADNQPRITHFMDRGWRTQAVLKRDEGPLAILQRQFTATTFTVTGCSENRWLLREEGPRLQHYRYHLFDKASQRVTLLRDDGEAIDPQHLVDKLFVQYKASDGMLLNGYLSMPSGVTVAQAPLVALIHGGPFLHSGPQYDEEVQLLTNRGYLVFEPNFRASAGFGQRYMRAANKDFGNGRVQQDMIDGLDWLLANSIGDRSRQAIIGGSFGGFAVLTALAYTPDRFQAGVAWVPPADFGDSIRLMQQNPDSQDPGITEFLRELILDINNPAEVAALYSHSPMAALSAIRSPLLIMAGGVDPRVDIRHVRQYTSRLLMERKPVSLLIDEHESHGFVGADATTAQLYLTEAFLAARLHGRVEPLQDDNIKQYLQRKLLVNQTPGFAPLPGEKP